MKQNVWLATLLCLVTGCANHVARDRLDIKDPTVLQAGFAAQQSKAAGAPSQDWFNNHQGMDAATMLPTLTERLDALGAKGQGYEGGKARCLIDAAKEEYEADNQWGFVQEAMDGADHSLRALESGQNATSDDSEWRTVSVLRPDLWLALKNAKQVAASRRDCDEVKREIACGEVQLMHAGHEAWRRSFDKAERRVNAVEASLADIQRNAQACQALTLTPPPTANPPVAVRVLKADALFKFSQGDEAGLSPAARSELDAFASSLASDTNVQHVDIVGYTDRLGSEAFNTRLSGERAATVRGYLEKHGVNASWLTSHGEGASNAVVQCNDKNREALIACLAPNRRVEVRIYHRPN